ncbi:hypothetical protein KA082_02285 [Candidatus Woesebacteria bacterium]|nr:hypothetical protein [Candidatus Woesebacteria bacterium]
MLHKLDLTDSQNSVDDRAVVVDDERLVANNHFLRDTAQDNKVQPMNKRNSLIATIVLAVFAIVAGLGTGYGSHKIFAAKATTSSAATPLVQVPTGGIKEGDTFGSTDKSTFKDDVKGYLEKGGLGGEGSHKLLRDGGPSQTVYMTSSVTDLDKFEGMEVEVWGETFSSEKAGWLMDVGSVTVLKTKGTRPADAEAIQ